MKKVIDIIYGIAMLLILGGALLADGLAEIRHGFSILIAIVGVGCILVLVGNWLEDIMYARAARRASQEKAQGAMGVKPKDPQRQLLGKIARAKGEQFESRLDAAFAYYKKTGFADVEKTPEPMKPIQSLSNVASLPALSKKRNGLQRYPFKGRPGNYVRGQIHSDPTGWSRAGYSPGSANIWTGIRRLGLRCFVVAGFSSGRVYLIPWNDWKSMKALFGRKYATESDLDKYLVQTAWNGTLLLLK